MKRLIAAIALTLCLAACNKEEAFNPASEDDFIGTRWTGSTTGTTESGGQTVSFTTRHEMIFSQNNQVTISSRSKLDTKGAAISAGETYTCVAGTFSFSGNTLHVVINVLVESNVSFPYEFPFAVEGTLKGKTITLKESPIGAFSFTKEPGKRL